MSHVVFDKVNSSTPIKLTGRHLLSVDILQSYIADLPWPGIFLHNTSRDGFSWESREESEIGRGDNDNIYVITPVLLSL